MPDEKVSAENTHIRCNVIIEILGKPKEHVEKTIRMYIDKIKNDSEMIVLKSEFSDAREKDELWAEFAELEMVIKGIPKLISFCFDYMPSSVEIIKPEEFSMRKSVIENFINDLQARLHQVDMVVKKQNNESEFLKQNLNKSVSNIILISLASGSLDIEKISKITGIHTDELKIFLDNLIKDERVKKEGEIYTLIK